ncbi:ATP-binding protein [Sediminibacillus massiliensis]|uniref:ATP-binding protein n=1 Tax=Sediminibacillus massiliensis TaxID=1926277 RepID=UPI0009886ABF|nr:ATP-binding protein [Sediminibacillus massiliensis]
MDSEQSNKDTINNCNTKTKCKASDHYNEVTDFVLAKLPENMLNWIEVNGYDLITICDLKGYLLYVSNSVQKILGYDAKELIGTKAMDYLSPYDQEMLSVKLRNADVENQKCHLSIRNSYGKYIWVESVIGRLYDQENDIDLLVGVTKDMQDKKEAEEMMIRSEKMSVAGQLAAGVAHEIRNPLTSIKGFLQLLQAGIDRKQEYYKIMVEEIEKIETITSELLFISKPMTEARKLERLSDMLNDVILLLRSQAKLSNIEIHLELEDDQYIFCDRSQIKQVFINLIKNAVEAMEDGGNIVVRSATRESVCVIDIIDEGPGIPESILHKLKEPFFTTKKTGTGLGLMISNQIIEKHKGNLEILRNPEKGSTFRIVIPCSAHQF